MEKINISNVSLDEARANVEDIALKFAADDNPLDMTKNIFSYLEKISDVKSYFEDLKESTNYAAKEHLVSFKEKIEACDNRIFEKIKYAILGNIIDFGIPKQGEKDFKKEFSRLAEYEFGVNDFDLLLDDLKDAKKLVYLCDNSGEIIFDLYFIEELKSSYPDIDISLVMRSKDILNDVTVDDIKGLGYTGNLIEGDVTHPWKLRSADIVISKGQGNFEGLFGKADFNVYYFFVAKCKIVADIVNAEKGNLILLKAHL
jgi:uncharacterized protein with ATP-grasp and redox domains